MKPKTIILMVVAIVCGLAASYMTSRLLADRAGKATADVQGAILSFRSLVAEIGKSIPEDGCRRISRTFQHLALAVVSLVGAHDPELGEHAPGDDIRVIRLSAGANPLPEVASGDQRGLHDLRVAGGQLGPGERAERAAVRDRDDTEL